MRLIRSLGLCGILWLLGACQQDISRPVLTPTPTQTFLPTTTISQSPTSTPASLLLPAPTSTPAQPELIFCVPEQPTSLYLSPSDRWLDQFLWGVIYDGPLNATNPAHSPTLLTDWPNPTNHNISQEVVQITAGQTIWNLAEGQPEPYDGPTINLPQMVVTFTLKNDVFWSDGVQIKADDSILAFHKLDSQDERLQATFSYTKLNSQQIRWVGLPNYHAIDYAQFFIPPLPAHHKSAKDTLTTPMTQTLPLGWGPYVPTQWTKTDYDDLALVLQPNPIYWGNQPANFSQIIWLIVPDSGTAAALFMSRQCDLVFLKEPVNAHIFISDPYGYVNIPTSSAQALHILSKVDPVVISALGYAIDGMLLADLLYGTSIPNKFDPGRAEELLDEAGWVNIDGQRQREQQILQLQLAYNPTNFLDHQAASILQAQFAEIGITLLLSPTTELTPAGVDLWLNPTTFPTTASNLIPLYTLNQFSIAYHQYKPYLMDPVGFPSWSIETWPKP